MPDMLTDRARPAGESHPVGKPAEAKRQRPSLRIPIAYKFALAIALMLTAGMTLLGMVVISNQAQVMRAQIDSFGRTIAAQLAESAKEPILANDTLALEVLATSLESSGRIIGTAIFSEDGRLLARSGITPFDLDAPYAGATEVFLTGGSHLLEWAWGRSPIGYVNAVSVISPVRFQDVTAGYTLVTFSRAALDRSLRALVQAVTTATILFILLGLVMSYFLGRRLSQPIHRLMDASQAIQEGRFSYRIQERRNDEIGHLISAFNGMAEGLLQKSQVEAAFSRYVSPKVAAEVLANIDQVELGGKAVKGSVLFADLVGYTRLSEQLGAEAVAALLNEYFSYISQASGLFHGSVDKFIGDCAMLVFGVPEPDEDHAYHAVACGVLIQRLVERINVHRGEAGLAPIRFRLGLNTGEMLAGNMGSRDRMQYTVVGDTVNLASRLCSIAGPGQIVISEELYCQSGMSERVVAVRHRPIQVRGKEDPVTTYVVRDIRLPNAQALQRHVDALLSERGALV
jgi:adenylate cyclase